MKNSAPKNAAKNITSLKMNQLIPQRNELSTFLLKSRASDSPITVPNQPNSMTRSTRKPAPTSHGQKLMLLTQHVAPSASRNSAHEPVIGQCEGWGT